MRIEIKLLLKEAWLPKDYRPTLVSVFKSCLLKAYPETYEKFYESGPVQKDFSFSVELPRPKFEDERAVLENTAFYIVMSALSEETILRFYNAFIMRKGDIFPISGGNTITIDKVSIEPTARITTQKPKIRFMSPLVLRHHEIGEKDRYYIWEDAEFEETLHTSIESLLGHTTDVTLTPVLPKKAVVAAFGVKLRSSLGIYEMSGNQDDMNTLLKSGMGSKRNIGFGLFRVVG